MLTILQGDALEQLRALPDESVHCCVTSPPYWGLRDYGTTGQIGLEPTVEEFISKLVAVFREVRRVLKKDGTCWVNMGDCYAGGGNGGGGSFATDGIRAAKPGSDKNVPGRKGARGVTSFIKSKDLVGVPWMLAFALRGDGWWLRGDQIWAKPNGMPESVSDRPTRSHEYVFMLTKSERYFYDAVSVRLPAVPESIGRLERAMRANLGNGCFAISGGGYMPPGQPAHQTARRKRSDKQRGHSRRHNGFNDRWDEMSVPEQQSTGSALRSVWWLAPANSADAHFAVMPASLAATCIMAGCPVGGTVLDPFGGSGTTGAVAIELARKAILIELNPAYIPLIERRCSVTQGLAL